MVVTLAVIVVLPHPLQVPKQKALRKRTKKNK